MNDRVLEVALPLPVQTLFSYRLPEGWDTPAPGVRVVVPFGARRVIGVVASEGEGTPDRKLKDVFEPLDEAPLVGPALLELAAWVSDHYLAPPGECYRLVLPPAGVRGSRGVARLTGSGGDAGDPVVAALKHGPLRVSALARRLGRDPSARLAQLRRSGHVVVEQALETGGFKHVRVAVLAVADAAPSHPRCRWRKKSPTG